MKQSVESLLEKEITGLGYEFIGLECISGGNRPVYRLYADVLEVGKGLALSDCQKISRHINAVLTVAEESGEIKMGDYILEVSSPGLDRKLFNINQCTKHIGKNIKFTLHTPQDGRKKFTGELLEVLDSKLQVIVDGENLIFEFVDIDKIRLAS